MAALFYIHFNEAELTNRLQELSGTGLQLSGHWSTEQVATFGDKLPDILIVSLDRLPSHGRQYVDWLWQANKRRHIPVIFVDGKPEKVETTKEKFPAAVYCTREELPGVVEKLFPAP